MKKLIAIMMIIVSGYTFYIFFNIEKVNQQTSMDSVKSENKYNYNITFPEEISNRSQSEVYKTIKQALDISNGNIYYSRVNADDGKATTYIYATDFNYFNKFLLADGTAFDQDNIESNKFLSSEKTSDENQIGRIFTFAQLNYIKICTLKSMVDDGYVFSGGCVVTFKDNNGFDKFKKEIKNKLGVPEIQPNSYQTITISANGTINKGETYMVVGSIYFVIVLLILYDILKSHKKIGIEKMMGYSNKYIWWKCIIKLFVFQMGIMVLTSIIMGILMFREYNNYAIVFLIKLIKIYFFEMIGLILSASIPFIYINKIKVSDMIKNKQLTKELIIFNFFVKGVILFILVSFINQGINDLIKIKNIYKNYAINWEEMGEYVSIPSLYNAAPDIVNTNEYKNASKNIYLNFNKQGAIYADFSNYVDNGDDSKEGKVTNDYRKMFVTVNPNYLNMYSIYDSNGNKIKIDESDTKYIALVPEKYKENELELFELWSKQKIDKNNVEIIWIKDNQKLFSMNMDVNIEQENYVTDPIVRVLTEKNGVDYDYNTIIATKGNPFKIKVPDNMSIDDFVKPVIEDNGIGQYIKTISRANEQMTTEIKKIKETIVSISLKLLLTIVAIIILIIQNIYNYFEQYKQRLAVRKLHGYFILYKYKELFILIGANWLVVFVSAMIVNGIGLERIILISLLGILIEAFISLIILGYYNSKKILDVIKGSN